MRGKPIDRHLVAIVDGNQRHREQVSEALAPFYVVHTYGDSTNALMGLGVAPPGLVLIGESVPPSTGVNFLRAMRFERELGSTPAIFVSDRGNPEVLAAALSAGADDCIIKPYRRSSLLKAVSAQLNIKVERKWKELPPLARNALQDTLSVYNSIADIFDQSYPIQYGAVAESCTPLVDAVNLRACSYILDGVKDHDNITYAHSVRVATLLALFGQAIGLPKSQQLLLACGGLLHDVGKMAIRHDLLNKTDHLTDEDWEIIRSHVPVAVSFLRTCADMPKGVVTMAAQHHERLDGSGYPRGLSGSQLNELARMTALIDVFSAMTEPRVNRTIMSAEKALKIMAGDMASQFDLELLVRFREIVLDVLEPAVK